MKKASKKLLSFFLAVVMVVTSCSVGFTAFAEDNNTDTKYWNDVTTADKAFDAIGEIVNTALPSILGIEINGKKISQLLNMSDDEVKNATLQQVVAKASPLLGNVLGASTSVDEKTFLISHSDITGISSDSDYQKYGKYFAYLTDSNAKDGDLTFYDLYTFCENNQNSENSAVAAYCTETLEKLYNMLNLAVSARSAYNTNMTNASKAMQAIRSKVYKLITTGSKSVADIGNTTVTVTINGTSYTETVNGLIEDEWVKSAVEIAQKELSATGCTDVEIKTVADALVYYYTYPADGSNYRPDNSSASSNIKGITYQNALLYIQLAQEGGKPITTKKLGGNEELTVDNYKSVLKQYITDSKYKEGENDYYYITKAVFDCLGDMLPDGTSMDMTKAGYRQMDSFASSSYDAINKAVLARSGLSAEEIEEKIEAAKITDTQLETLIEKAKEILETVRKDNPSAGTSNTTYWNNVKSYLQSDDCPLSAEAKKYLTSGQILKADDLNMFIRDLGSASSADDVKNIQNDTRYTLKTYVGYRHNGTVSVVNFFNEIVSGYVTKSVIGSVASGVILYNISSPEYDCIEINADNAINGETKDKGYSYSNYTMPSEVASFYETQQMTNSVAGVNTALNNTIGNLLDSSTDTGAMVVPIINGLMESDITLYKADGSGVLNDIWQNLYDKPMETIFNLLPTLVILVEEVVLPMVVNAEGDEKYQALDAVFQDLGITLTKTKDGETTIQNTKIGVTDSSFDLNTIIPGTLAYITGDTEKALKYCGTYSDFLKSKGFEKVDGINGDTIMFTGVYAYDMNFSKFKSNFEEFLRSHTNDDLCNIVNNLLQSALEATEEYLSECVADSSHEDYRYKGDTSDDAKITQRGLNNIAVSLPKLLDKIGQKFIKKYDVNTDWTYLDSDHFTAKDKTYRDTTITQTYNSSLEELKSYASVKDNYNQTISWISNRTYYFYSKMYELLKILADNSVFKDEEGTIYDNSKTFLISCKTTESEFTVPDSVELIFPFAFAMNNNLSEIKIPYGITLNGLEFLIFTCRNIKNIYFFGLNGETHISDSYLYGAQVHHCSSVVTPSTCKEQGYITYICSDCGASYVDGYLDVDSDAHSFKNYKYNNDATCTTDGTQTATCEYGCGTENTITAPNTATGHNYDSIVTAPTCKRQGFTTYICKVCGDSYTGDYVDSHSFKDYKYNNDATCTTDGTQTATCEYGCGTENTITAPNTATGHNLDDGTIVKAPTCTVEGSMVKKCTNKGCDYQETVSVPTAEHTWSNWKYNNDAVYNSSTDYTNGTQTRTCTACGESETKEAPNTALLRRRGNALSLESSITLTTYITKDVVDYYDEVYAEFTRNNTTEKVYASGESLTSGSTVYYVFDYNGISPQTLGDDISITFYGVKDGVKYNGTTYKYSPTNYITSTLKSTTSAKLKTLLVDLVYYGEACQVYQNYKTDNLLTDILTDEQKAFHSTADLNLTNIKNSKYSLCDNRLVKFGTALRLNNSVEMAIPMNMTDVTLDELSLKVKIGSRTMTYSYAKNPENFEKGSDGYWYFYFDGVYANQMSDEVFITAYKGDEQVSYTLKYSVESYASTVTNAKLKAVTDAMMRYGYSAKAYAGK